MGRNVSDSFKQTMSGKVLPLTHFRINFGIEAPQASSEAVLSINRQAAWSDINQINDKYMPTSNYATAELNSFILGSGRNLFPEEESEYIKDKFTSANVSQENCEYMLYPTINIQFTNLQTVAGLTIIFDEINKTFPSEIKITGLDGTISL